VSNSVKNPQILLNEKSKNYCKKSVKNYAVKSHSNRRLICLPLCRQKSLPIRRIFPSSYLYLYYTSFFMTAYMLSFFFVMKKQKSIYYFIVIVKKTTAYMLSIFSQSVFNCFQPFSTFIVSTFFIGLSIFTPLRCPFFQFFFILFSTFFQLLSSQPFSLD